MKIGNRNWAEKWKSLPELTVMSPDVLKSLWTTATKEVTFLRGKHFRHLRNQEKFAITAALVKRSITPPVFSINGRLATLCVNCIPTVKNCFGENWTHLTLSFSVAEIHFVACSPVTPLLNLQKVIAMLFNIGFNQHVDSRFDLKLYSVKPHKFVWNLQASFQISGVWNSLLISGQWTKKDWARAALTATFEKSKSCLVATVSSSCFEQQHEEQFMAEHARTQRNAQCLETVTINSNQLWLARR